jgi:hypothetical protein
MFQEETRANPRTARGGETHIQTITKPRRAASVKHNENGPKAVEQIRRPWDQPRDNDGRNEPTGLRLTFMTNGAVA